MFEKSDHEKYAYLLMKLSEKMQEQDNTIFLQKCQIDELEKKLAEANKKGATSNE